MILNSAQIDRVLHLLRAKVPSIEGIYLFGSGATDSFTDESDVDLAVISKRAIDNQLIWDLKFEIAEGVNREVDLVDLYMADTVMQMQVVTYGERGFSADKIASDWFESRVWWNYLTLNEDRAVILEEIRRNKTIYG